MKKRLCVLFQLFLLIALAIWTQTASTQTKSTAKQVVIRAENNQSPFFYPSERLFDLTCRVLAAGEVSKADASAIRDGMVKIPAGTRALELSRIAHFKKVEKEWIGKVHIRLTSGPQKGKDGYVFAKWVFPAKNKAKPKALNYPLVSVYDPNAEFVCMFKSRKVFDLAVRGLASEELTHEEQGVFIHGVYKLIGRTHARLISSKDYIPTPDGRYVGYSYVELTDGPYKGKRGLVFIDQGHE